MMQNTLIEPIPGDANQVSRADRVTKSGFKFDGSPDQDIFKEVERFFTRLISDDDVLESTKIDINVLAKIVAQVKAIADSFESLFFKNECHEKTLVDIIVLHFPDTSRPYFQLYRIKLVAWTESRRVLFVQEDNTGITGEFNSRKFKPRNEVIDNMKESIKKKAVEEAEDLLG